MKNKMRKVEFINMLKSCLLDDKEAVKALIAELLPLEDLDFHDQCFLLFLLGEYTRISENLYFYQTYSGRIEQLQDEVERAAYQSYSRLDQKKESFYSDNFGMAYGALYNSNLFLKREKTAEAIHEMKNYAYSNYTCAGRLIDEKHGNKSTARMLWLCVPFGLFTPEDLVLVAAIPDMQDTEDQIDFAMLGWYFAEKADYRQARNYLGRLTSEDEFVQAVKGIIEEKLRQAGMLSESPILHIPCGNFNRYEHRNYERDPWFPKNHEEVYLNIATWPVQYPEEITVFWRTSKGRTGKSIGCYQPEYENYHFSIGNFDGGEEVRYYFQAGEYRSKEYTFLTQEKEIIIETGCIRRNEEQIVLELRSNQGRIYRWVKEKVQGLFQYKVESIEKEACQSKATDWHPIQEAREFFKQESGFEIEKIFFWKEGEKIITSGIRIAATSSERFYGFGERYNDINQRGNLVDVYVYNQYKDQGIRTYFPMPYFLSSEGYGFYLPTDHYVEFDLCREDERYWKAEVQTECLSWYRFAGTPKEMIGQFTNLTGRPVMMPEWAFGPWMSSNNWDSEAKVRKQVELTKKYDIPSTVLVIEAWSDEATYYIFNDAVYKENSGKDGFSYSDFHFPKWGKWPNPKGLVEYLHENGLKCILWQIPIVKYINSLHHLQKDRDEKYALEQGYCARKVDGMPYRMPEGWFTDSLLMDYTSEEACEWWMKKRQYLVDEIQIDGFKTDGGEFVFGDNVRFADGRTGKEMRNEYPNLYIQKYYDYIHEKRDGIVFSRAGFTGACRMPAHWAGDEKSTFSAFRRNLCAGLNAGISGVPFWGWDLAGFSGEIPSAELFARSAAMAAFCPIMQYHAESKAEFNQDRTPWNIAERQNAPWVIDVYRYYAKLRIAMLPYIMESAEKSTKTGVPMMRALWLEFPEDEKAGSIFDQYMFGDDFMVAPIVEESATDREVYIPQGIWRNIFTNETFSGRQSVRMHVDVKEIIVLQRQESSWNVELDGEFLFTKEEE